MVGGMIIAITKYMVVLASLDHVAFYNP